MGNLSYCPACKRNIGAKKVFSWTWFLLGLLTYGVFSALYLVWYVLKSSDACSICGCEDLYTPLIEEVPKEEPMPEEEEEEKELP
jgi:hypothetical protein